MFGKTYKLIQILCKQRLIGKNEPKDNTGKCFDKILNKRYTFFNPQKKDT